MTKPNKAGRLPDFIVVGSVKCGTTSLHYYLSLHPEIHVSRPKELNFFIGQEPVKRGKPIPKEDQEWEYENWWQGIDWYRKRFVTDKKVCGEISPCYVHKDWIRKTVQRMKELVPTAKILLLVREPLSRLWSHYLMLRMNAVIKPVSFAEFVANDQFLPYRAFSHYGSQLQVLLDYYPKDSIKLIESNDLENNRITVLEEVFDFLGVDKGFRSDRFGNRLYEGSRRRFPSQTGEAILRTSPIKFMETVLPFTITEWMRSLILIPFSAKRPEKDLPAELDKKIREEFRKEVELLRKLSGLPFASLQV